MSKVELLNDPSGIKTKLNERDSRGLRELLESMPEADIAEACSELSLKENIVLLRLISRERRPILFAYYEQKIQETLLHELPELVISSIVNGMESDDRTRMLEGLSPEARHEVMLKLSPDQHKIAWQLLNYPEDSVGRLMNTDFLAIRKSMTVQEALSYIRWRYHQSEKNLEWIFVTNDKGVYEGELSPAALITIDPLTKKIEEEMGQAPQTLNVTDEAVLAVDYFRKYDVTHYPVTDSNGKLVGYVTADDVFDVAEDEATEDIQQFGGVANLEDSYFQTPLFTLMRKRAGWLSILFVGELFTGSALKHYDETIASMGFLIYFVPLILSSGGNSGSQAASLIIRGIAVREMQFSDWRRVFHRESITGICLGLVLGVMGAIRAWTWGYPWVVSAIVSITLVGVVCFGAVAGSMLPFMLKRVNVDPAVSSSPFIASLVDLFGILIFVNVAIYMTNLVGLKGLP
ncbi:MAG: magnesium transporter [Oligoflexales bacterium]|nr:magnesium transporter [Oligoflexales bacterium]